MHSRGLDFISVSCADYNPCHYSKSVLDFLVMWAKGEHDRVAVSPNLRASLSPLQPLSKIAREFLRERLVQVFADDKVGRRRAALAWVDGLDSGSSQQADWDTKPKILEQSHWRDLHAGALFFTARGAAAIAVLDRLEAHIGNLNIQRLSLDHNTIPAELAETINALRKSARAFLAQEHDPSSYNMATMFCRECVDKNNVPLLINLVSRDGRVLRLRDRFVVPGPAFRGVQVQHLEAQGSSDEEEGEAALTQNMPLPEGISSRVRNLFLMNLDLHGKLDEWLSEGAGSEQ